jgi:hypothetical protein
MTTTNDDVTSDLSGVYLKKQDVEDGSLSLVIASVDKVVFDAKGGKPAEAKWVLTFTGDPVRRMTLNKTNLSILAKAFGKKTGPWTGQTIEIYLDESVMFAGQLTGGIRVRILKQARRPVLPAATLDPDDPLPAI